MPEQTRPGFTLRLALENSSSTLHHEHLRRELESVRSKPTLKRRGLGELCLEPTEDEHEQREAGPATEDDGIAGRLGQVRVEDSVSHRRCLEEEKNERRRGARRFSRAFYILARVICGGPRGGRRSP